MLTRGLHRAFVSRLFPRLWSRTIVAINIKFAGVPMTSATACEIQRVSTINFPFHVFSPFCLAPPPLAPSPLPLHLHGLWTWQGQMTTKSGPAVSSAHAVMKVTWNFLDTRVCERLFIVRRIKYIIIVIFNNIKNIEIKTKDRFYWHAMSENIRSDLLIFQCKVKKKNDSL